MKVKLSDYVIKDDNVHIKRTNIEDVFLKKFDITWAAFDEGNHMFSDFTEKDLEHRIGPRTWDRIPIERFECDHSECDGKVIYQYNNEYYRCDDFKSQHDGLHILFAGCSETEGVGGSIEDTWTDKLYKRISESNKVSGFYSIARSGYGWQKIITNFQVYVKKYGFPNFLFVLLPNVGREYRYYTDTQVYRYYQLYPENHEIDDNGICTFDNNYKIPAVKAYENNTILLQEYYKTLIDFKISWELFEKFCETNGTKMLWSTYDLIDMHNINFLNIGKNFFSIDTEGVDNYIKNQNNFIITKNSFKLRDGHSGSAIKEYWAKMFENEITNRGIIKI